MCFGRIDTTLRGHDSRFDTTPSNSKTKDDLSLPERLGAHLPIQNLLPAPSFVLSRMDHPTLTTIRLHHAVQPKAIWKALQPRCLSRRERPWVSAATPNLSGWINQSSAGVSCVYATGKRQIAKATNRGGSPGTSCVFPEFPCQAMCTYAACQRWREERQTRMGDSCEDNVDR